MPQVLRRKGRCFMKRLKNLVLMLVLVLTSGLTTAALAAEQPQECISLSGTAEAEVAPDMATLYINLETKAPTAVEARDGVAAKLHDIQNVLLGESILPEDAKSTNYNLSPVFVMNGNKRKQDGFRASSTMRIKVQDLDRLGAVIDKCITKGATSVDRVEFGLKDRGLAERNLLAEATENARQKAAIIANAGGRNLGPLIRASVNSNVGRAVLNRPMMMKAMAVADNAAFETALEPGTISLNVSVETVFALQ